MKRKKKLLYAVLALLIQGAGAAYGQNDDTVKNGQQDKEVSYAGIKMEQVGENGWSVTSGLTNADERIINDTELTYSGKWEFNRLLGQRQVVSSRIARAFGGMQSLLPQGLRLRSISTGGW